AKTGILTASDTDGDTPAFAIVSEPSHGTLTSFNAATGSFTYTPTANYHGPDSFTFTASDGTNTGAAATVSISVVDTSTPAANEQSFSTNQNIPKAGTLRASDSDRDAPTFAVASGPRHGVPTSFNAA